MKAKQLANLNEECRILIQSYLDKGNSINKLSEKSGVHSNQLWFFLRGERGLTIATLEKIGKALEK